MVYTCGFLVLLPSAGGALRFRYFEYDWSLNDTGTLGEG